MVLLHDSKLSNKSKIEKLQSKYLKSLLPHVFRSEGDMAKFDPLKILKSLKKETELNKRDACHITELVVRRIISSGIKFLSGPHIREIVCSILSEQHYENERKLYTRIGMPLMDYEAILEGNVNKKSHRLINPEEIHQWAAKRISNEYTLLRILNSEESQAHLYGDIHIHNLPYFDLRPYSQKWDPRMILEQGLPPVSNLEYYNKSGPAKCLKTAISHLAKWLAIVQCEFSGFQCYEYITMVLAPYAVGLTCEEIEKIIQQFIYEINQVNISQSTLYPLVVLNCIPTVPKNLLNIPAIGPYGKIIGKYGDFKVECLKLFNALTNIYIKGDHNGKPFNFPKREIRIEQNWIKDFESSYLKLMEETISMGSPYFFNMCPRENSGLNVNFFKYQSVGSLQNIILNLPRYAYLSHNEDDCLSIINDKIEFCSKILLKKYELIEKRLKSNLLPLCSGTIKGERIYKLQEQKLSISFIGLNEMVKDLTNFELHEDNSAYNYGKKVVQHMAEKCKTMSERDNVCYNLSEESSGVSSQRLARLDMRHFPEKAKLIINKKYTNSCHLRENIEIPLFERIRKQANFHPIINGKTISNLPLKENKSSVNELWDLIRNICLNTSTTNFTFYFNSIEI
jgi:ribonucleoside-triphosphate reductase